MRPDEHRAPCLSEELPRAVERLDPAIPRNAAQFVGVDDVEVPVVGIDCDVVADFVIAGDFCPEVADVTGTVWTRPATERPRFEIPRPAAGRTVVAGGDDAEVGVRHLVHALADCRGSARLPL